ncbi:MAG: EAL domain-containing protein, partial [Lachnospiraceae bacterium]|nr:EAL domain-containing protein [Lachnospiraceae bacterium]
MDENKLDLTEYVLENFDAAQKNEWIKVYYQPVIRTLSRELCGMEALARWDDPVHGLLSPGVFIPALESAGRIHELDIFMLQMICRDYRDYFKKNSFLIP